MIDEADTEILIGLSEEERGDLQKLIEAFNDEEPLITDEDERGESTTSPPEDVHEQIKNMSSSVAEFNEQLLQLDAKMASTTSDIHKRFRGMGSGLAEFGEKLLKLDTKLKSFYKILLLCYKKTELMNERIDATLAVMVDRRGPERPFQNVSERYPHKKMINRKNF
jgi:DNA repair exonuclease SbcCD ATPase subunit